MKYSKAHLAALETTVYGYEKTIACLENGVSIEEALKDWKQYGGSCRLCDTAPRSRWAHSYADCSRCIINRCNPDEDHTFSGLQRIIKQAFAWTSCPRPQNRQKVIGVFKARLEFILSLVDKHGYVLEAV